MATLIILLLFILAACLLRIYFKASCITFLVAFFCFIAVGSGLFPLWLTKHLEAAYTTVPSLQWQKRNAIILLGAGTVKLANADGVYPSIIAYSRINEAAKLYLSCKKSAVECTVIISGGDVTGTGVSEAAIYRNQLLQLGISNKDIFTEQHSLNTYQNAKFTRQLLKAGNFNQLFLVTSAIHLKRSLLYFSHFGVYLIPAPSDYLAPSISILPLGYNFAISDFAIHEYIGIASLYVYDFLNWNKSYH